MSDYDNLIEQFSEVTGSTAEVARFYLESSDWILQDAISNYLASQGDTEAEMATNDDVEIEQANSNAADEPTTSKSSQADQFKVNNKTTKPKIATLQNLSRRSSSDEEGQAFYAGGSERSGQQVLGPPKRKNFREILEEVFRQAQEQSLDHPMPSTSSGNAPNWGTGLRLGQTEDDHSVVNTKGAQSQKSEAVVLKLWRQGFSINDGDLRQYDDQENREFLESIMRGEIPSDLVEMGSMVRLDIEDHQQEDFKRKVKKTETFKGSGYTLGSPAPEFAEEKIPEATTPSTDQQNEGLAVEKLNVNPSEEVTQLQIRLADGSRITPQFNVTHTVRDVRRFIETARPQYANRCFTLFSSFPRREIADEGLTIMEAGLKNAAIMQHLK